MKHAIRLTVGILILTASLAAQTISEKKASLQSMGTDLDRTTEQELVRVNREVMTKREEVRALYKKLGSLYFSGAPESEYLPYLNKIQDLRQEIKLINEEWQKIASESAKTDIYTLFHQPETTLEQLIIDYGSQEYVYVMPQEIAEIKLNINSSIAIPRSSWSEMIELILEQNGVGIRQLNPFLRELYLLDQEHTPVKFVTNDPEDLEFLPPDERIAFIIEPDPSDTRRIWTFLDRFINPSTTSLTQIGREILIVSQVNEIQDLLRLFQFVAANKKQIEYRLVPLRRIKAEEMAKVIQAMFDQFFEEPEVKKDSEDLPDNVKGMKIKTELTNINGLKIIVLESLSQAIFLVGTPEEIDKAETMIQNVERQIAGGREKVIQWYNARHTAAEELAEILQKVYDAMIKEKIALVGQPPPPEEETGQRQQAQNQVSRQNNDVNQNVRVEEDRELPQVVFRDTYYQGNEAVIDPAPVGPTSKQERERKKKAKSFPNFIVDQKSGSIVMVVEKDLLPSLMEVIEKIDVPAKMVQIDVLLFERRFQDETDYGLNLLRIGSNASNVRRTGIDWNNTLLSPLNSGIFEFFISRPKSDSNPAFDLSYRFMLTQEDVHINANPSVVTINQTPAFISIVEERSISTGVAFIEVTNGVTEKDAFVRAQYGITLEITPTIHWAGDGNGDFCSLDADNVNFISLETKVNFDTIDPTTSPNDRPDVIRREIKNDVLIGDGQTVVLGGLRRKTTTDSKEMIPFLGEIPGFGKLFSINSLNDTSTEMFIFLTPRIIADPCEDIERIKYDQLSKRPGDTPSFLFNLNESLKAERDSLFKNTLRVLFGRPGTHYYDAQRGCVPASYPGGCSCGEYDGR